MTDVSKSPAKIAGMFDAIAARYDFLNHLLSAGIDRRWRRRAIASLSLTGRERVLDLCTGTGDLALTAMSARPAARAAGRARMAASARSAVPVHRSSTVSRPVSASDAMARRRHRRSMPALNR